MQEPGGQGPPAEVVEVPGGDPPRGIGGVSDEEATALRERADKEAELALQDRTRDEEPSAVQSGEGGEGLEEPKQAIVPAEEAPEEEDVQVEEHPEEEALEQDPELEVAATPTRLARLRSSANLEDEDAFVDDIIPPTQPDRMVAPSPDSHPRDFPPYVPPEPVHDELEKGEVDKVPLKGFEELPDVPAAQAAANIAALKEKIEILAQRRDQMTHGESLERLLSLAVSGRKCHV